VTTVKKSVSRTRKRDEWHQANRLVVGRLYKIVYDDGTELDGEFVKQERRGFIEFRLGDGSRLVCRTGSVKVR